MTGCRSLSQIAEVPSAVAAAAEGRVTFAADRAAVTHWLAIDAVAGPVLRALFLHHTGMLFGVFTGCYCNCSYRTRWPVDEMTHGLAEAEVPMRDWSLRTRAVENVSWDKEALEAMRHPARFIRLPVLPLFVDGTTLGSSCVVVRSAILKASQDGVAKYIARDQSTWVKNSHRGPILLSLADAAVENV